MPSIAEYFEGAAFLAFVCGICTGAGWLAVARALPALRGASRGLAVFTLGTGAVVAAHGVPVALGVLGRPAVIFCALVLLGAARLVPAAAVVPVPEREDEPEPAASRALAGVGLLAAATGTVASLGAHAEHAVTAIDALTIHLPQVARYLQGASLADLAQFFPDQSHATYPQNGTMLLLAGVLPWESTFAARFVAVPFLVAMAAGVFLVARELGAPATASALAAAAVAVLPGVAHPALLYAQSDAAMLAWFTAGALFLLRSARSGSRAELALAGIALGLAFGTKWYAVAYVPVLVLLWAVATRGRSLGLLAGAISLTGGVWLARNWVRTGNPVYPAPVGVLGVTVFDAPPDRMREMAGFSVVDYRFDGRVWREYFLPAWKHSLGLFGMLLLPGAVVAASVTLLRAGRTRPPAAVAVVVGAVTMAALYTVLPDTALGLPGQPLLTAANSRYLVPALLAAAVTAAWLAGRGPRVRLAMEAALLAGVLEGVARSHDSVAAALAPAAALVAAGVVLCRRWPRASLLAACAGVLVGGLAASQTVDPAEYGEADPVVARLQTVLPSGGRVAIAGTWSLDHLSPVLPAFGPRLRNRVDYLGPFVEGTLRRHRQADPFVRQLREGGYDAVVVGKDNPTREAGEEPEAGWAERAGFWRAAESPHLVLLLVRSRGERRTPGGR